jgi:hypothetical protein
VSQWRALLEGCAGPEAIVVSTEAIESQLLRCHVARRRPRHILSQSAMHALVTTILLRFARLDPLWRDAQLDPPNRQLT